MITSKITRIPSTTPRFSSLTTNSRTWKPCIVWIYVYQPIVRLYVNHSIAYLKPFSDITADILQDFSIDKVDPELMYYKAQETKMQVLKTL